MADDIKIKVGVQSNVKAGMDGVVRDVEKGADRARQAVDKSMRGKGFAEAFSKVLRGDISGALEDLQERMGKGFSGIAAKALVWGGGIATALIAGFKAGQKLDEMFGLSDKAGGWLGNTFGTKLDDAAKSQMDAAKKARQQRDDNDTFAANAEARSQAMRDEGDPFAEWAKMSDDDRAKASASHDAQIKQEVESYKDGERQKQDAARRTAEIEAEFSEMRKAQMAEQTQARRQAVSDEITQLNKLKANLGGRLDSAQDAASAARSRADALNVLAHDPDARQAQRDKDRDEARANRRRENYDREMAGRLARGVRGESIDAWREWRMAEKEAAKAQNAVDDAQKQIADNTRRIADKTDQLLQIK